MGFRFINLMKFAFHQKKKKKLIHQSNSLWKRKERENSNTDLLRRAESRWSAISSPPLLRPITGICLTLCLFPEKFFFFEFFYHGNYLADLSKQLLVFSLILFIGRERLRSMAQRESSSLIRGYGFEYFWNWNCVAILWNLKYELDLWGLA